MRKIAVYLFSSIAFIIFFSFSPSFADFGSAMSDGIPIGGLGTGKIEILPDGSFGHITTQHNPDRPIDDRDGCFAAIHVSSAEKAVTKYLRLQKNHGVERVHLFGSYPIPQVEYQGSDLPVSVRLKAFSPLFPRSLEESCQPVAVFLYRVKNTGSTVIDVSLAMSWPNLIGRGGTATAAFSPAGRAVHTGITSGPLQGIHYQFGYPAKGQEQNAEGEYVLACQEQENDRITSLLDWQPRSDSSPFWSSFSQNGELAPFEKSEVEIQSSTTARPAGALAVKRTLLPGETGAFPFFVFWYMPHQIDSTGKDHGVYYTNGWKSVLDGVKRFRGRWQRTLEGMEAWRAPYIHSSIPSWIMKPMFDGMEYLCTNGVAFKNGTVSFLTEDPAYPGNLGSPEERLAMMPFFLQWYPDLFARELERLAASQLADGEVPCAIGNVYSFFGTGDVKGGFIGRPDAAGAFVLMAYAQYMESGDVEFIKQFYPHIRAAISWMIQQDTNADSIPDGNTYSSYGGEGVTTLFTADIWLAVLQIGEELAQRVGDPEFQSQCRRTHEIARNNTIRVLWNGAFLQTSFSPHAPMRETAGRLTLGMLPGTWFASKYGWNPLLAPETILQTAHSLANGMAEYEKPFLFKNIPLFCYSFTPSLLNRLGLHHAAGSSITETMAQYRQPIAKLGLWSYMDSLTGLAFDMPRQCLIVGPSVPPQEDPYVFPLHTAKFSGRMEVRYSPVSGQKTCRITIETLRGDNEFDIQQVAFKQSGLADPNAKVMRVLVNEEFLVGQDYTRQRMRVFQFDETVSLDEGDTITLLIVPKQTHRIAIDLKEGKARNLGARCSLENFSRSPHGFRFDLHNLLGSRQIVFLEIRNTEEKTYDVYLNEEKIPSVFTEMEPLPLVLGTSEVDRKVYRWYQFAQQACSSAAVDVAKVEGRPDLKKHIFELQDAIKKFLDADIEQRGFRISVIETGADEESPASSSSKNLQRLLEEARDKEQAFFASVNQMAENPTLASEITGHFVPVTAVRDVGERRENGIVPLTITLKNPLRVPLRMRVNLQLPAGWSAVTDDPVSIETTENRQEVYPIAYRVTPPEDWDGGKINFSLAVSGTWRDMPFRKVAPFAIGHNPITKWMVIGPFSNQRGGGIDYQYEPETNVRPDKTYEGVKKQEVQWTPMQFMDGFVNFDALYEPDDFTLAYAYVAVYSSRERIIRYDLGCNGDAKVFLNYKEIYKKRNINALEPGGVKFYHKLYEGWNHIIVKISESTGRWGFTLEISDIHGQAIPGLDYSLEKY